MERKRREKKFKLLQKLPHHPHHHPPPPAPNTTSKPKISNISKTSREGEGFAAAASSGVGGGRGAHAAPAAASSSSSFLGEEEEGPPKPLKKRRTDCCDRGRADHDADDEDLKSDGSGSDRDEEEEDQDGGRNVVPKSNGSASATTKMPCSPAATPLPDRRTLEAVLDKLQKKDTYGVYAEPVDPEELPDYHDTIEHPMDFSTIRKKLASDSYANFEQFEKDVFLICTNAMQYNSPETIYYRQACLIQELARKKFQCLRVDSEAVLKSVQRAQSNSTAKKPIKRFLCRTAQEPAGSDISSAATIASMGDACTELNAMQNCDVEKPLSNNGHVDDSVMCENKSEVEELSAKGSPAKIVRRPSLLDENRRTTYNVSNEQDVVQSDLLSTTFEMEQKKLVSVGLHAEYSYARSLARFAGSLGSVAWKIASHRIEKSLPKGVKFGPGWVGEYEPLPTPVLSLENHIQQQSDHSTNLQLKPDFRKDKIIKEELEAPQYAVSKSVQPPKKPSNPSSIGRISRKTDPLKVRSFGDGIPARDLDLFGFTTGSQPTNAGAVLQQHNGLPATSLAKNHNNPKIHVQDQILLSHYAFVGGTPFDTASLRPDHCSEAPTSRALEMVSSPRNMQSETFKQPETVISRPGGASSSMEAGALSRGKDAGNTGGRSSTSTSLGFIQTHHARIANDCFTHVNHDQTIDDPAKLLRMKSEKMPYQTISSNSLVVDTPKQVMSTMMSPRYNSSVAATAAARAWMSIGTSAEGRPIEASSLLKMQVGAVSLRNPATESLNLVSQFHEGDKKRPMPQVPRLPNQSIGENYCIQDKGLGVFPQFIAMDLSKLHGQPPWQGQVPHAQQKSQKNNTCPPDLNIGFHSPGSPVRQSSSILVDSQQPDLVLQL